MAYGDGLIQWYESLILLLGKLFQIITLFELRNTYGFYDIVKSMHFTFLPVCLEIGIIDENIPKNIFEAQMEIFYAKKVTF